MSGIISGLATFAFVILLIIIFPGFAIFFVALIVIGIVAAIAYIRYAKKPQAPPDIHRNVSFDLSQPAAVITQDSTPSRPNPVITSDTTVSILAHANAVPTEPITSPTIQEPSVHSSPTATAIERSYQKDTVTQSQPLCRKIRHDLSTNKALLAFQCYIVMDFETTGLSPEENDIIEFAVMKVEAGEEVHRWHSLVNPGYHIPAQITKLTGISDADVASSPALGDVIFDLNNYIGNSTIVAHNASFDISFLVAAFQRHEISANISYVDTVTLARKAFPTLANHKLQTLIEHFNLSDGQSHRAMDDVECTQQLLKICISQILGTAT